MARAAVRRKLPEVDPLPDFIPPQKSLLLSKAPADDRWVHEIKFDGYRMGARIDHGRVKLLTKSGLNWADKYAPVTAALKELPVEAAYIDGEVCALRPDGSIAFSALQAAGNGQAQLVFFAFDLLHVDGRDLMSAPLLERKAELQKIIQGDDGTLRYSDHFTEQGPIVQQHACRLGLEGVMSKRIDAPYKPGNRGLWVKSKCLGRQEFVVVGWTNPEGARPYLGSLLLGYFGDDGSLFYAGRVGTGMSEKVLRDLHSRLQPLAIDHMPLSTPPPRNSRFGRPLELKKVRWVRPEMVVEVTYLTWTADDLLRHVVFQGLREDKPAKEVRKTA